MKVGEVATWVGLIGSVVGGVVWVIAPVLDRVESAESVTELHIKQDAAEAICRGYAKRMEREGQDYDTTRTNCERSYHEDPESWK